jgi:extracellular elastinolytic metalloproteinase
MTSRFITKALCFALFLSLNFQITAQKNISPNPNATKIAVDYVIKQQSAWDLTVQDVQTLVVQDAYPSLDNGVMHVYLIQQHKGIELYNAISTVNVMPNGEVLYAGNRFMRDLAGSVNTTEPTITPEKAIEAACKELDININNNFRVLAKKSAIEFLFDKGTTVLSDINVKLRYQKINDKTTRLVWDLNLDQPDGQSHWSVRVDALTGKIIDKGSWTHHCVFEKDPYHRHTDNCSTDTPLSIFKQNTPTVKPIIEENAVGDGSYRVFALPIESPTHGNRTLEVSPADAVASPYGWHDVNGAVGGEYKITRGNNVWAYLDTNGDNVTDATEPNGGTDYIFDNPFLPAGEPDTNKLAAQTQLFYVNNKMHDIFFRYGFDEVSGNFQQRNYTGETGGADYVKAEAQDAFKAASPSINNANFSTPPDGSSGRMQMFVWSRVSEKLLKITAPTNVVNEFEVGTANFGAALTTTPVMGDVVLVNDGTTSASLGCKALVNTNLTGKIALIDRGTCDFSLKVYNAQLKGAIACIICNFEDALINMGGGQNAAQVTIPSVFVKNRDCLLFRNAVGLKASLAKPTVSVGPDYLDGDFDNGIMAHEYGHGISTRLTGGKANSGCLGGGESGSAGEAWSDFLALAVTAKAGDVGTMRRGMGTYVYRQPNDGQGIRTYPYSTDMKISPVSYDELILAEGFGPGPAEYKSAEVLTNTLWDMYWAFVGVYGWDANIMNINSGNGKAIKIVIEGMKIQPCSPGFLDIRDAILAADRVVNNGVNQCLIWDVFSKRGMGMNAIQGKSDNRIDNSEGFEPLASCIKQLKITKKATDLIKAGDAITYTITVTNHKGTLATGVVVNDDLPVGTTYLAGSASRTVTVTNGILTWTIGDVKIDSSISMTYRVTSNVANKSIAQFTDDMETGEGKWEVDQLKLNGDAYWQILDIYSRSGKKSFSVGYPNQGETDQLLTLKNGLTIAGKQPVLRFFHRYQTEPAYDAGIVQVTTNNGTSWEDVGEKAFRTPYRGKSNYTLFTVPNQRSFWGRQDTFLGTYIDLKDYIGKNVKFRFRFATDSTETGLGWFIDDVAVMDAYNYTSRARVTSTQKDTAFAEPLGRGTIVDASGTTPTKEISSDLKIKVFPNPTDELLNINITGAETAKADVQIISADGRIMWQTKTDIWGLKENIIPVYTANYPAGIYIVKISTDKNVVVEKIVKK